MKSSIVITLVAAGVVAGGGVATYALTQPSPERVQVRFVDPAGVSTPTSEPTTATVTVSPTATVTASPVAVTSSSTTTHKATVQKEATVSQPAQTTAVTAEVTPNAPAVKWGPNGPPPNPSDSPAK